MLTFFNQVIAAVKIGNYYQLLDATNPYRPYNLLDVEDLNFYGFIVDIKDYKWIDITVPDVTKSTLNAKIDLSKPDIQTYEYNFSFDRYFAVNQRKIFNQGNEAFISENFSDLSDYVIDSIITENLTNLTESFIVKCYFHRKGNELTEQATTYYSYMNLNDLNKNPFYQETRIRPIDLAYKFSQNFNYKIYLPENITVEETPKSKNLDLVDKTGKFNFISYIVDSCIYVESKITIDETLFFADEYDDLKSFYSEIITKFNEQITLTKK